MRGDQGSIIQAGDLDTLIRIEAASVVADTVYGTDDTVTWALVDEIWAQVRDILPSRAETAGDAIELSRRPARIRARWRDDIDGTMRVVIQTKDDDDVVISSRELRIISPPAMLGRREGVEFIAEEYSTKGSAA